MELPTQDPGPPGYRMATRDGLAVLEWPIFDAHPVRAVVTTRQGGVSSGPYSTLNLGLHVGDAPDLVIENRRRAAGAIGLPLDHLVFCNQAHGREVVRVNAGDRGRGARSMDDAVGYADALVTSGTDVGLAVMVADCVPIVLFDPGTVTLACVHAGWRGTVAGVAQAAVSSMVLGGAQPRQIVAGIGPAIPAARYQVGPDVKEAAQQCFGPRAPQVLAAHPDGRWRFDLWTANRLLLEESGLRAGNIALAEVGTGGAEFFSDRAARPCGRFAALARITDGPRARARSGVG